MTPIALAALLLLQSISPGDSSRDAAQRGVGITPPRTGGQSGVVAPRTLDPPAGQTTGANLPDSMVTDPKTRVNPAEKPAFWTGTAEAWARHKALCTSKHPSYHPESDTIAREGVRIRCPEA